MSSALMIKSGFFLYNDIGMGIHKVFVVEGNMANDAQSVGYNAKLENITKMSVDIKLFNFGVCGCIRWHVSISSFVWVIV